MHMQRALERCGSCGVRQHFVPDAPRMSVDRMERDVAWLADDAREGRGLGTSGLSAAATYIAKAFEEAGFSPGGDAGSYLQRFEMPIAIRVAEAGLAIRGLALERGIDGRQRLDRRRSEGDIRGPGLRTGGRHSRR